MFRSIRERLTYIEYEPLYYNKEVRKSYEGLSVSGSTLKGKKVFITGATGGLGEALVRRFLLEGSKVIISGRNEEKLEKLLKKMNEEGYGDVEKCVLDVASSPEIIFNILNRYKKHGIDILINNAGIYTELDAKRVFRGITDSHYDKVINTNYRGAVNITNAVLKVVDDFEKNGTVIMICSLCALSNNFKYTPYGISKAAMMNCAKKLKSVHPHLNVHSILPGSIGTSMNNIEEGGNISGKTFKRTGVLNRCSIPEEVAALTAFLSSDIGKTINKNEMGIICAAGEVL